MGFLDTATASWRALPFRWQVATAIALAFVAVEIALQVAMYLVHRRRDLCVYCYTHPKPKPGGVKACQCGRKLENS